MSLLKRILGTTPHRLRDDLLNRHDQSMARRRAIIITSLAGAASMGTVTLLQTGIVRHLPDPPLPRFDSDSVNISDIAYAFGTPDAAVSLASFAINAPLAGLGGADRASRAPWIPLAITAKAAVEAAFAGWYFIQMPTREKAWCGYCILGAAASFAVLGLSIPEAREAWRNLRSG